MVIRKAKLKDIPEINKVNKFGDILKKGSPLDQLDVGTEEDLKYYKTFLYGKDKWCYVAEEDNKIVGFILFLIKTREPFWEVKKVGYIDLIYIKEDCRKKGMAKQLLEVADQIFKKKKIKYLTLSYQTDNNLAEQVWKKQGFKEFRAEMYKKIL